jgi:hypothetical protein
MSRSTVPVCLLFASGRPVPTCGVTPKPIDQSQDDQACRRQHRINSDDVSQILPAADSALRSTVALWVSTSCSTMAHSSAAGNNILNDFT